MIIPAQITDMLARLRARFGQGHDLEGQMASGRGARVMRTERRASADSIERLWRAIPHDTGDRAVLADVQTVDEAEIYGTNIENLIGTVKVPVGVVGPISINGLWAKGAFHAPLATTEAALVASYARGAQATNQAGGITTAVLSEEMMRTPAFVFDTVLAAGRFIDWVVVEADRLRTVAEATTRHGKLISLEPVIDNEVVFLICRFTTGNASGQNMVTLAADAVCQDIAQRSPIAIKRWYIEGNFSGDKKGSYFGILRGRGRKVSASVVLPGSVIAQVLRTSAEEMLAYARVANQGSLLAGQIGAQAHYANALAALYIATGQDAACVAESAVGFTRLEPRGDGLFATVTMPNILVGTVGGGTGLPSQAAARRLIGLPEEHSAAALAELVAALCLCGELSIVAAIAAGHFARAHRSLARER